MGELYEKVQEIQHQGYSPPDFVRIDNIPYYGITEEQHCPINCKDLHHEILCNNEKTIKEFYEQKYHKV